MSYRHFLEEVKKGLPEGNYLLSSSDQFLQSEAGAVIRSMVPEAEQAFNFLSFDIAGTKESSLSFDYILDILNTMPFFSGCKFVVVENTQKLIKKDLKKLAIYLAAPSESSKLFLLYSGQVKKDLKDALKGVKQILLDISEQEIPSWLKSRAALRGVELRDGAAEYLVNTVGTDLGLLASEIEKCSLIGKSVLEKEDIEKIIEEKRTYNAFALINAIGSGNRDKLFRIYRVLKQTEEPYGLLGALNWQYGKYFAEKNSPKDRAYYRKVFGELNRADRELKSSSAGYPMELLLVRLLQLSRQR